MHVPRGECPIVKLTRESKGGWDNADPFAGAGGRRVVEEVAQNFERSGRGSDSGGGGEGGGEEKRKLRFGIVMMCDEGMWPEK